MNKKSNLGIFVSGPSASAMIHEWSQVEALIAALASVTGDDNDDYTATDLDNPIASPEEVAAIQKAIDN